MDLLKLFKAMLSGWNLPFTLILLGLFGFSVWLFLQRGQSRFTKTAPALLTSIGIFGTFFGIVLALLGFDGVDNIKQQLDVIIRGMQTAFVTSVTGLFLSISLKFITLYRRQDDKDDREVDSQELIHALLRQSDDTEKIAERMDKLLRVIGKDNENSMQGQIRQLRTGLVESNKYTQLQAERLHGIYQYILKSYQDKQAFEDKLWQEMRQITETLSKSATETIIEALKNVIKDFNKNLTEQFGENFKQLNQAVFKLVEWQENYKHQLGEMKNQYDRSVGAIERVKLSLERIEHSASAIPNHMIELEKIIQINQEELKELYGHLHTFTEIRDKAVAALPEIQGHIHLVLTNMREGSNEIKTVMINTAHDFNDKTTICLNNLGHTSQVILERAMQINSELESVARRIAAAANDWLSAWERAMYEAHKIFKQYLEKMTEEQKTFFKEQMADIERIYEETKEKIQHLLKETQEQMHKRQEEAIVSMAKSLLTITQEFGKVYSQSNEQMSNALRRMGGGR